VAPDVCVERIAERLRRGFEPARDVLRLREVGERNPAGEHDIDEHEDPLCGQIDKNVAR
jgi:hypothetical protein